MGFHAALLGRLDRGSIWEGGPTTLRHWIHYAVTQSINARRLAIASYPQSANYTVALLYFSVHLPRRLLADEIFGVFTELVLQCAHEYTIRDPTEHCMTCATLKPMRFHRTLHDLCYIATHEIPQNTA